MAIRLDGLGDLEDLALETGATVQYANGTKFNTSRIQGNRVPRQKPPPVVPPTPEPEALPAGQQFTAEMFQQLLSLLNRPVEVRIPDIPAPQVTVSAPDRLPQPVRWSFEFERNPNGTIKRIHATPTEE